MANDRTVNVTSVTVDGNKLIEAIGADNAIEILDLMGINLDECNRDVGCDLIATAEWQCSVDWRWWPIEARQKNLTDLYAVRWTETEEAGVDDVIIVERVDDEQDQIELLEWLHEIACGCGSCNGKVR